MAVTYLEIVDSVSPCGAGFSMQGGRAQMVYDVVSDNTDEDETDPADECITDMLGAVTNAPGAGGGQLSRSLPKAHPRYPYMNAVRISSMTGVGVATQEDGYGEEDDDNTLPSFAEYPRYRLHVDFEQLPYAVFDDSEIDVTTGNVWYDDSGAAVTGAATVFTTEYTRFTDYEFRPGGNYLTAKQGQMSFFTSSSGTLPFGKAFGDNPRIFMGDGTLLVTWYQVPEYYITSPLSYINMYKGRINQLPWLLWGPGQIRYDDYTTKRYTPPSPILAASWGTGYLFPQKLVDITFQFAVTARNATAQPFTESPVGQDPANLSYVAGGWNAQPWLTTRQFYYTVSVPPGSGSGPTSPASGMVPAWLSFAGPQLLFTDPTISG